MRLSKNRKNTLLPTSPDKRIFRQNVPTVRRQGLDFRKLYFRKKSFHLLASLEIRVERPERPNVRQNECVDHFPLRAHTQQQ